MLDCPTAVASADVVTSRYSHCCDLSVVVVVLAVRTYTCVYFGDFPAFGAVLYGAVCEWTLSDKVVCSSVYIQIYNLVFLYFPGLYVS